MTRRGAQKKTRQAAPKGFIAMEPEAEQLIALLDAGKVEEFRRRVDAARRQRRHELFTRVLSAR
jgi:hypothetical protein